MSPIVDIQYQLRELGRLRLGARKGNRPVKLESWRLTSASRELLEAAADAYGGEVKVWESAPNEGEHFELFTEAETIDVVIPPNDAAFSQWMELWSGGGCQKRCDGKRQVLRDIPCSCPKDIDERIEQAKNGKACKPTTRLNVMLPKIPDIGVWRLETHGYYAAQELAGVTRLLQSAGDRMIAARLRIDQRSKKRPGKTVNRYTVPVIELLDQKLGTVLGALGAVSEGGMIALPGPVEPRSLPGDQPALPSDASFGIESDGWGSDEPIEDVAGSEQSEPQAPPPASPADSADNPARDVAPPETIPPGEGNVPTDHDERREEILSTFDGAISERLKRGKNAINEGRVFLAARRLGSEAQNFGELRDPEKASLDILEKLIDEFDLRGVPA